MLMKKISKKTVLAVLILAISVLAASLFFSLLKGSEIAVLNPKGEVAASQRDLIVTATLLMLIVVGPVFALTFAIAWKYRAANTKARYSPNLDHNRLLEFTWWAIPSVIILVLAVITWKSSHALDPYKALNKAGQPVKVQVVAMQWKWLFIYPQQNLATVNAVYFPQDRPVNFEITSDAPMNSFWIPQLGGQVYAMAGMKTKLHLAASEPGAYGGVSANLSGEGFSDMNFTAYALSEADFAKWVESTKLTRPPLTRDGYKQLALPSAQKTALYFSRVDDKLFEEIVMKYMKPAGGGGQQKEGHH